MTEKDYKKELKNKLIQYRDTLNLPSDVTFGIEIEYEGIIKDTVSHLLSEEQLDKRLIGWKNKSEFNIAEFSKEREMINGEINSPVLKDTKKTWKDIKLVLELLKNNDAFASEKCGAHVNIGGHIFENNIDYIKNFILLWILFEKEIKTFSSGENKRVRRDTDNLFKKINGKINIENLLLCDRVFNLTQEIECLFDKHHRIYFHKPLKGEFIYGNVVEFRIPNGTLNEEIWQNYINFFTKFILACKKELDVEKVIYKIKNNEHDIIELANFVFDDQLDIDQFLIQSLKTNKIYSKFLIPHKYY